MGQTLRGLVNYICALPGSGVCKNTALVSKECSDCGTSREQFDFPAEASHTDDRPRVASVGSIVRASSVHLRLYRHLLRMRERAPAVDPCDI